MIESEQEQARRLEAVIVKAAWEDVAKVLTTIRQQQAAELTAIFDELRTELDKSRRMWEEQYGVPYPKSLDEWIRLAVFAGVPADVVFQGNWTLRYVAPIIEGCLLKLRGWKPQPLTAADQQTVSGTNAASGPLSVDIAKFTAAPELAESLGKMLGPIFERLAASNTSAEPPKATAAEVPSEPPAPPPGADAGGPEEDPYDDRVAQWMGKRIYLGHNTEVSRLFWLLAKPVGAAASLAQVQRAIDGMETTRDMHPDEVRKATLRLRKVISKLRKALREAGLDDHVLIVKAGTQTDPEYSMVYRFEK